MNMTSIRNLAAMFGALALVCSGIGVWTASSPARAAGTASPLQAITAVVRDPKYTNPVGYIVTSRICPRVSEADVQAMLAGPSPPYGLHELRSPHGNLYFFAGILTVAFDPNGKCAGAVINPTQR